MAPPGFSIVTPTLNAERYLRTCLRSVRAQAVPNMEHLVVDGGSSDRTREIARAEGAHWIAKPGCKQAAAINVGFRLARGDVLAWLNADDHYVPGALSYVAECFGVQPELDVVLGDCDVIDSDGKRLWHLAPGPYSFERLLRNGNSVAQPAVFLRRRVIDRVGLLDEDLEFAMDFDFWLRLKDLHVEYRPRTLAAFRWHAESKTATHLRAGWRELLDVVRRHGGGWTPSLLWSYMRAHVTMARAAVGRTVLRERVHR